MKTCTKCGQTKDESEFYKDNTKASGRRSACIECTQASYKVVGNRRGRNTNPRRDGSMYPVIDGHRVCATCGQRKPVSEFYRNKASYALDCKACSVAKDAAYKKIKKEMKMNARRFRHVFNDLNQLSKKIFTFVPCVEAWPIVDITYEVNRSGMRLDRSTVGGVLNTLKASKIVVEPTPGTFKRANLDAHTVKCVVDEWLHNANDEPDSTTNAAHEDEPIAVQPATEKNNMHTSNTSNTSKTAQAITGGPIEILSDLSSRMAEIVASVQDMVERIDAAAILLDEQNKAREADTGKLRQLQALLKSLGE